MNASEKVVFGHFSQKIQWELGGRKMGKKMVKIQQTTAKNNKKLAKKSKKERKK